MDKAYISAFFGLMGALVGGVTSIGTAWVTQRTERRDLNRQAERAKREGLYGDFVAEASRLYGDALSHEKGDVTDLVRLYALLAKLRLFASGILMRNTLILIGQIHTNRGNGLDPYHAVVEATVQRARPVILTALAALLAFVAKT